MSPFCNGGGRHKDVYASVITCEYLFQDYDVITFDFRGHHESGGIWTGDGGQHQGMRQGVGVVRGASGRVIERHDGGGGPDLVSQQDEEHDHADLEDVQGHQLAQQVGRLNQTKQTQGDQRRGG